MRCPSCGTENAPDSRFCGGCGALQQAQPASAAAARLAPTAKIPDDAPLAPPTRQVAPIPPTAGVSYSPPSMPPPALVPTGPAGLTTRPGGHAAPPRAGNDLPRPSGDHPQVRASSQYGQVQQRPPSHQFDSVTPTVQNRTPARGVGPVSGQQRSVDAPQGSSPRPRASEPSLSFEPPRRSTGLIAAVLIIDLALAAAGAMLLAKGLSGSSAASAPATSAKPSVKP